LSITGHGHANDHARRVLSRSRPERISSVALSI
jgi:hypothetical protein